MNFADSILEFQSLVSQAVDNMFKDVVIEVGESVISFSPVLTGRFKGNWQLSVSTPTNYSLNTFDPTGASTLSKIVAGSETLTAGEVAYIVNNLTYGYEIEVGGWPSGKEPYMPVRLTEARFAEIVNAAVERRKV